MSKKLQLKTLVVLGIIIVIIVYLYINKGFSFGVGNDFQNLKDSIEINVDGSLNSAIIKDLQERFNDIKEQVKNNQENVKSKITERVLDQLTPQDNIIYEYEPWGIKFTYDSLMIKEVDQDNEKISLFYENIQNIDVVIEKYNLEGTFNDWLNNNYDLQILDKQEYNELVFWKRDISNDEDKVEEYYLNLEDNVFIISLQLSKEQEEIYWESLENIVKSFNSIKSINL